MSVQSSKPWHRRRKERVKAYGLLVKYLEMGDGRSLAKLADKLQEDRVKGAPKLRQLSTYSATWDWVERANAYDADQLLEEIKGRVRTREKVRQVFYQRALDAARVVLDLMDGIMELGDTDPIFDKHQDEIGRKARVPASVRAQQAQHVLAMAGLIVPKRVELDASDGDELRLQARQALGALDPKVARMLIKALQEADKAADG
jgi:hypothetical protein